MPTFVQKYRHFFAFFRFDDCPCKQMPSTKQCLISHVRTVFSELPSYISTLPPLAVCHSYSYSLIQLGNPATRQYIFFFKRIIFFSVIFLSNNITVCPSMKKNKQCAPVFPNHLFHLLLSDHACCADAVNWSQELASSKLLRISIQMAQHKRKYYKWWKL